MSCLIHALLPSNYIGDQDKENNPDKNDGFEMGTWNFPPYLEIFDKVIGKQDYFLKRGFVEGKEWGHDFKFTKKQCNLIYDWLKKRKVKKYKDGRLEVFYLKGSAYDYPLTIKLKWHKRMLNLFKTKNVTYYSR